MNCFAGGVFLSIALIHLFPEGAGQFTDWANENGIDEPFPLFYTLTFVGYLIALVVDRVICSNAQQAQALSREAPVSANQKVNYDAAVNDSNGDEGKSATVKPLEIESANTSSTKVGTGELMQA